jgi:hypothetical protein
MIVILPESEDCSIRRPARILHPATSGYSEPENKLQENKFAKEMEAKSKVYENLMDISFYEFLSGFDEYMHWLRECFDRGGEYLCINQLASLDRLPMETIIAR